MPRAETVLEAPEGRSISARRTSNRLEIVIGPTGRPGRLHLVATVLVLALAAGWVLHSLLVHDSALRTLWAVPLLGLSGYLVWRLVRSSGGRVRIVLDRARFEIVRFVGRVQTSSYKGKRSDLQGAVVGPHPRPGSDTNRVLSTVCTLLEDDREHRIAPWLDETAARWVAETINDFLNETVTQRFEVAPRNAAVPPGKKG